MAHEYLISNFYICDTENDLPPILHLGDIAIIRNNLKIIYIAHPISGVWTKVELSGEQEEPGDIEDAWPIHSVFFTDAEATNPNTLLGFGTWSYLGKIPSLDIWGWKRTA